MSYHVLRRAFSRWTEDPNKVGEVSNPPEVLRNFFFIFFGKEVLLRIGLRYGTRPTLSLYTCSLTRETWIGPHFEELGHANRFSTSLISNQSGLLPLLETRGGFGGAR